MKVGYKENIKSQKVETAKLILVCQPQANTHSSNRRLLSITSRWMSDIGSQKDHWLLEHRRSSTHFEKGLDISFFNYPFICFTQLQHNFKLLTAQRKSYVIQSLIHSRILSKIVMLVVEKGYININRC